MIVCVPAAPPQRTPLPNNHTGGADSVPLPRGKGRPEDRPSPLRSLRPLPDPRDGARGADRAEVRARARDPDCGEVRAIPRGAHR